MNFYILMRFFRGRWTLHLGWNNPSYLFRKGPFNRGPIHRNSMYRNQPGCHESKLITVQVVRDALADMPDAEPIHVRIEKLWFSTTTIPRNPKKKLKLQNGEVEALDLFKRRNVTFKHTFRSKTKIDDKLLSFSLLQFTRSPLYDVHSMILTCDKRNAGTHRKPKITEKNMSYVRVCVCVFFLEEDCIEEIGFGLSKGVLIMTWYLIETIVVDSYLEIWYYDYIILRYW